MRVNVRERVKGSGDWWIFIIHQGYRMAKRIGSYTDAQMIAKQLKASASININ